MYLKGMTINIIRVTVWSDQQCLESKTKVYKVKKDNFNYKKETDTKCMTIIKTEILWLDDYYTISLIKYNGKYEFW